MFMKDKNSGDLIRIEDVDALHDPFKTKVIGRDQAGEEEQDAIEYDKDGMVFPSGEEMPRCWRDPSNQVELTSRRLGKPLS
jgi:hypothetical protein